jgi:CBS domain containing-hemolysin-like protein
MTEALLLGGALAGLSLSFFFSGVETGVFCLNRVRLRVRSEQRRADALRLAHLMQKPEQLVIAFLLGTNVADYVLTVSIAAWIQGSVGSAGMAEVWTTAICTPLVLVLGGIIPKDLFRRAADTLMYPLSLPLAICHKLAVASGIVFLMTALTHALIRRIDPVKLSREEAMLPRARMLRTLHEGATHGGLSRFQRETIERVMRISQVRVGSVMVPRHRAAMLSIDVSRENLLRVARMAHFSRLPIFGGDPRRVVGVINVYDVLMDEHERPVADYVREPVYLQANETVPAAILKLQQARQVMGVVTDAGGNCLGLFTMKDLVEEIVGELEVW